MQLTMSNLMKPAATQVANPPSKPSYYYEKSTGKRFAQHKKDVFSTVSQQTKNR